MKRLLHTLLLVGLSMIISVPVASAQRERGRESHTATSSSSRSSSSSSRQTPTTRHGQSGGRVVNSRGNRKSDNFNQRYGNTTKPEGTRPGGYGQGNGRPGNSGRPTGTTPGGSNNYRPGGNGGNHNGNNSGYRPGGNGGNHNGNNSGYRPGGNGGNHNGNNNSYRPGGSNGFRPGGNDHGHRPGNRPGGDPGYRPGGNNRPNPGHHGGYGHGHGPRPVPPPHAHHGWNHLHWGRPNRPWCPPPAPFYRPVPPPPHYNYYYGFPTLRSILGITIGTAINLSINSLLNSGYTVTGYGSDAVYLSNVPQLSYNWPDATLYFDNGDLAASEFIYSTDYFNIDRYNNLVNRLVSVYGNPYNMVPYGASGATATWWGPNGQFITLKYVPRYCMNGTLRYFTTLSFGI